MQICRFRGLGLPTLLQGDFRRFASHIYSNYGVLCLVDPVEELRERVERRRQDVEATRLSPGALIVLEDVCAVSPPVAEILDEHLDTLQDASCGFGCVLVAVILCPARKGFLQVVDGAVQLRTGVIDVRDNQATRHVLLPFQQFLSLHEWLENR